MPCSKPRPTTPRNLTGSWPPNWSKAKDKVRQAIEQATAGAIAAVIGKLENNQPLTEDEKQTVKLWVVGDAEGYVKSENNFQDWLEEYRRLMDVIGSLRPAQSRNW